MSFRKPSNLHDRWSRFCEEARDKAELTDGEAGVLSLGLASAERFEELLRLGRTSSKEHTLDLASLLEEEWKAFTAIVTQFSEDWETYFVESLYPAYFREVHRRESLPPV